MNLYLHGIHDFSIVNDDTLQRPAFIKNAKVQQFDVVLANPPYSIKTWNREAFAHDRYGRNFLGVPPQGRADYAFIQHILASMSEENGRCAILLPHGVLFRQEEKELRRKMLESDLLEALIGLGPDLFYNSTMEACVMICRKKKTEELKNKVIFINAVNEVEKKNKDAYLTRAHIDKIVSAYRSLKDIKKFCKIVCNEELLANDSDLSIQKYVFLEGTDYNSMLSYSDSIALWNDSSISSIKEINKLINLI